jgi:hypothetical protein
VPGARESEVRVSLGSRVKEGERREASPWEMHAARATTGNNYQVLSVRWEWRTFIDGHETTKGIH